MLLRLLLFRMGPLALLHLCRERRKIKRMLIHILCNFTKEKAKKMNKQGEPLPCGCPGSQSHAIKRESGCSCSSSAPASLQPAADSNAPAPLTSQLRQWPVQIKLAPINAPYFDQAHLLIAADCTAYAYANFHQDFIRNRITLVGCPKLDAGDYSEKLTEIIRNNNIKSVTVVRMEVPCCGGIERAAVTALQNSGKFIPWQVVTISTDGRILDR